MHNWYVFYVKTGREQEACDFLNKLFNIEESVAFIPQVEIVIRNSKIITKYLRPMFPGYVFVDSILDARTFLNVTHKYVKFSEFIFKILGNESISCMKLSEDEKNFLLLFLNDEYIAEESIGLIIGDKVIITSGPLQGKESIIKRIDRHKKRAEIELMCFGDLRRVIIPLEIVSKTN